MNGILLKTWGLVPVPSLMVSGSVASSAVVLNKVLDTGDEGWVLLSVA